MHEEGSAETVNNANGTDVDHAATPTPPIPEAALSSANEEPAETTETTGNLEQNSIEVPSSSQRTLSQGDTAIQENAVPPITSQPIQAGNVAAQLPVKPRRSKAKWFLPLAIGILVLLIGGGAYGYFGVYMQSPEQVWSRAMKNTAAGYNRFAQTKPPTNKGVKATGSVKISQPIVADGNLQLTSDDQNFLLASDAGMTGVRANLELRGLAAKVGDTPDLYVKIGGIKGIGTLLDPSGTSKIGQSIEALNEKWYGVDHTFIDQALASTKASSGASSITKESAQQIGQDLQDINKKVAGVLGDRLFTIDPKKAVVTVTDNLGKDTFKGRPAEHYRVKVQKTQLHDAVVALKDTLKTTKLNDWVTSSTGATGKTFEKATNFDSLLKQLDNADYSKATAEVWVDTGLAYVRNVRVTAVNAQGQHTGTIDFTLDYTGGDELPFIVTVNSTEKGSEGTMSLGVKINQKTFATKLNASVDALSDGRKVVGSGEVTIVGNNDKVAVQKPAGAGNLMELIAPFISGVSQNGTLPTTPLNLN